MTDVDSSVDARFDDVDLGRVASDGDIWTGVIGAFACTGREALAREEGERAAAYAACQIGRGCVVGVCLV